MASLVFTLTTDLSSTELANRVQPESGKPKEMAVNAAALLKSIAGGVHRASIRVQKSSNSPVRASGTITLASVAANDTVVIGGVTLTAKASPSTEAQFSQAGTNTEDAASLAAVINAHSTLSRVVSATSAAAVVTVTCLVPGEIGNFIVMSQTGETMTLSAFASGAGGATETGTVFSLGL